MRRLLQIAVLGILIFFDLPSFSASIAYTDLVLQNESGKKATLSIPTNFLDHDYLKLSHITKTGKTFKLIPLQISYPSFEPWQNQKNEESIYLLITLGFGKDGLQKFIKWQINPECCGPREHLGQVYGLEKYAEKMGLNKADYISDIYVNKDFNDPSQDIFIKCEIGMKKCRYYLNIDEKGNVGAEFSFSAASLSEWKTTSQKIRNFIKPFILTR